MALYELDDCQPTLGFEVWVAPTADVIGRASLGDHVSVWFGAVIRADNTEITIGPRTNVQEGALLHSDPGVPLILGEGVTIGHHAILHGCQIGDNTLIGMGATVLNGAVIGENCLVGAGALVTENKIFPPGSLIVGSPARAIRALTQSQIEGLRRSAEGYVAKSKRYAAGLARCD